MLHNRKWRFRRTISREGTVIGEARFSATGGPNTLHYREEGKFFTIGGQTLNVYREYSYRCRQNEKGGDEISVYFIEPHQQFGKLFHHLHFNPISPHSTMTAAGLHHCGNDTYKIRYEFLNQERFNLIYDVQGPHKTYISETSFERIELNAMPLQLIMVVIRLH